MDSFKTFFIINPRAGDGKGRRKWPSIVRELEKSYFGPIHYSFTEGPGHATTLATEVLKNGFEMVVAVGGDGTIHEVVNGFFANGKGASHNGVSPKLLNEKSCFGILSLGRGNDLIRALKRSPKIKEQVKLLHGRDCRTIDLGRVGYLAPDGKRQDRYFVNVADAGLGGDVVHRLNRFPTLLGGTVAYLGSVLGSFFLYRNKRVAVTIDGKSLGEKKVCAVIVANGQSFGGGLKIAPKGKLDDGLLDILIVEDFHTLDFLITLPRLYAGSLDRSRSRKIHYHKGKKIHLASGERVLLDVDGEQPGFLPAAFEIVPQALKVKE